MRDMISKLPEGWSAVPLSQIAHEVQERNPNEPDIPVLSVTKYDGFVLSLEYFKKQIFSKDTSNYKLVRKGQFAYATIHLDEGSIDLLDKFDCGLISPMYTVFEPDSKKVDLNYLRYQMKSGRFIQMYAHLGQGSINRRKSISFNTLGTITIPLPPITEQQKITAILSSVDEAIASTQAVIDQTRKVKQGLLQQLLTRGIGHTKFKHSAIGKIPESWQVVELGDITTDSAFGPRFSGELYDPNGNYGSVRTTDINENWEINYETVPRAMLPEAQCENHRLMDGDLLVTRSGSCGIVCVFREQTIPMIPGAFLIRFRLKNYANSEFVRLAMMTPTAQSSMATMAAGGVQKNLSGTNLKKLLLPLPLLDEQDKIVSRYKDVLQSEKSSQANLQQLEQLKRGLMQDLLTGRIRVKTS